MSKIRVQTGDTCCLSSSSVMLDMFFLQSSDYQGCRRRKGDIGDL
jgi:hypothetical protein